MKRRKLVSAALGCMMALTSFASAFAISNDSNPGTFLMDLNSSSNKKADQVMQYAGNRFDDYHRVNSAAVVEVENKSTATSMQFSKMTNVQGDRKVTGWHVRAPRGTTTYAEGELRFLYKNAVDINGKIYDVQADIYKTVNQGDNSGFMIIANNTIKVLSIQNDSAVWNDAIGEGVGRSGVMETTVKYTLIYKDESGNVKKFSNPYLVVKGDDIDDSEGWAFDKSKVNIKTDVLLNGSSGTELKANEAKNYIVGTVNGNIRPGSAFWVTGKMVQSGELSATMHGPASGWNIQFFLPKANVTYRTDGIGNSDITSKKQNSYFKGFTISNPEYRVDAHYDFLGYTVDKVVTTDDGRTFNPGDGLKESDLNHVVLNEDIVVTAHFKPQHRVTYNATSGGSVIGITEEWVSTGKNPVGSAAQANGGYEGPEWFEGNSPTTMDAIKGLEIDRDKSFTAHFSPIPTFKVVKRTDTPKANPKKPIHWIIEGSSDEIGAKVRPFFIEDKLKENHLELVPGSVKISTTGAGAEVEIINETKDLLSFNLKNSTTEKSTFKVEFDTKVDFKSLKGKKINNGILGMPPITLPVQYEVVTSVTNGTVDPSNNEVAAGVDYKVKYSPNEGYELDKITVDENELSAEDLNANKDFYTFKSIADNHKIHIDYKKIQYDVVTSIDNGTITPSGKVEHGGDITVNFTPSTGYEIDKITVDGKEIPKNQAPNNSYTFEKVKENHKIDVTTKKVKFRVETEVENGIITPSSTAEHGDNVNIEYAPVDKYHEIKSLTVNGEEVSPSDFPNAFPINGIDKDYKIKVVYEKELFDITTSVTNGTIDPSSIVRKNLNHTVNFTPNEGYELDKITVDGNEIPKAVDGSYTFESVSGNHSIHVDYKKKKFNIETVVENGTIDPSKVVEYSDDYNVTYNPKEGYELYSIKVDGEDKTGDDLEAIKSGKEFSKISSNHKIEVVYAKIPEFGIVKKANAEVIQAGEKVTYTVTVSNKNSDDANSEGKDVIIRDSVDSKYLEIVKDSIKVEKITKDGNSEAVDYEIVSVDENEFVIKITSVKSDVKVTYDCVVKKSAKNQKKINNNASVSSKNNPTVVRTNKEIDSITPDFSIIKSHINKDQSVKPGEGEVGDKIVYTIEAKNLVKDTVGKNVAIEDKLPVGVKLDESTVKLLVDGKVSDNAVEYKDGKILTTIPKVEKNAVLTFEVEVVGNGVVTNTATVQDESMDYPKESSTTFKVLKSKVTIEKNVNKKDAKVGDDLEYSILVKVVKDSDLVKKARGIVIKDSIPEGITVDLEKTKIFVDGKELSPEDVKKSIKQDGKDIVIKVAEANTEVKVSLAAKIAEDAKVGDIVNIAEVTVKNGGDPEKDDAITNVKAKPVPVKPANPEKPAKPAKPVEKKIDSPNTGDVKKMILPGVGAFIVLASVGAVLIRKKVK